VAGIARAAIARVPGAVDVRVQQAANYPGLEIDVDRVAAARLGLTAEDVVKNVSSALVSSVGFDPAFWLDPKNGNHYFLGVQYRENTVDDLARLGDLPVAPRNGGPPVPLKNLAAIRRKLVDTEVDHVNIRTV